MPVGIRAFATSVAHHHDEDAVTLACEAALPIVEAHLRRGLAIGSVSFASTAAPFAASSASALVAAVCDLPFERVRAADFAGSPRAGAQALLAACERLVADPLAADALVTMTGTDEGGAGAAFVLGRSELVAEIIAVHSVAAEIPESGGGDAFATGMRAAIAGALATARVEARDVARYALAAPGEAAATALLERVGVGPSALVPAFDAVIGTSGTAQPWLALCTALESTRAGEVVVAGAWGDGADVVVLRATGRDYRSPRPLLAKIAAIGGRMRAPVTRFEARTPRLRARCRSCGAVEMPPRASCGACGRNGADRVRLPRHGTIASLGPGEQVVIDLEGGGRVELPLTDGDPSDVAPGTPVELTFRAQEAGAGERRYLWKARPVR